MCLQKKILKDYQSKFPNDSLRMISDKTGIQVTRVFRLMNGNEMKISEYEAFNKILKEDNHPNEFLNLSQKCYDVLSPSKMNKLKKQIYHFLAISEVQAQMITETNDALELA